MNFFILLASDSESINGDRISALEVAELRLSRGLWPIYRNTSNKSLLGCGDKCLIYLAGNKVNSQHFIAIVEIDNIKASNYKSYLQNEDWLQDVPDLMLGLKNITAFQAAIPIRPLLKSLTFMPKNSKYWGVVMQGGCKKIPSEDFSLIVEDSYY